MGLIDTVKGFVFRKSNRPSPLKTELAGLFRNIERTSKLMAKLETEFWERGGVCCPYCGVRGFSELSLKQERRIDRINQIETKLRRDSHVVQ